VIELPLLFRRLAHVGAADVFDQWIGGDESRGRGTHLRVASRPDRDCSATRLRLGCVASLALRGEARPSGRRLLVLHGVRELVRERRRSMRRLGSIRTAVEDDVVANRERARIHGLRGVCGGVIGVHPNVREVVIELRLDSVAHGRIERLSLVALNEVERGRCGWPYRLDGGRVRR
jgi:hypothetical protein